MAVATAIAQCLAGDKEPGISCTIDGKPASFTLMAKAVFSKRDGLEIIGFTTNSASPAYLVVRVPQLKTGTFTGVETPSLQLTYSLFLSSNSKDHYGARGENAGSALKVTIDRIGEIGETIQGSFSGVLGNGSQSGLVVTNGFFSVTRERHVNQP